MKKDRITIIESPDGDWTALYFNGKLLFQNHCITLTQAMAILQGSLGVLYTKSIMTRDMVKAGRCPDSINAPKAELE